MNVACCPSQTANPIFPKILAFELRPKMLSTIEIGGIFKLQYLKKYLKLEVVFLHEPSN